MIAIENFLACLRFYNTLIKFQIKVSGEDISGDEKIPFPSNPILDLD